MIVELTHDSSVIFLSGYGKPKGFCKGKESFLTRVANGMSLENWKLHKEPKTKLSKAWELKKRHNLLEMVQTQWCSLTNRQKKP